MFLLSRKRRKIIHLSSCQNRYTNHIYTSMNKIDHWPWQQQWFQTWEMVREFLCFLLPLHYTHGIRVDMAGVGEYILMSVWQLQRIWLGKPHWSVENVCIMRHVSCMCALIVAIVIWIPFQLQQQNIIPSVINQFVMPRVSHVTGISGCSQQMPYFGT